jgi:hypothetical protein
VTGPLGRAAARGTMALAMALAWAPLAQAAPRAAPLPPAPFGSDSPPHHMLGDRILFGGEAGLRLGHDRVLGVGNPDLLSVSRLSGFAAAPLGRRVRVDAAVSYDRATDDVVVERARLEFRFGATRLVQAGVLPLPLLEVNLRPDVTSSAFVDRSLVETGLVGVPSSQLGLGVAGERAGPRGARAGMELDVVTGYGHGVVDEAPDGTRVPAGRSGAGLEGRLPALVGRGEWRGAGGDALALSAYGGQYNQTRFAGVTIDHARFLGIATAEGDLTRAGFRFSGEAALVHVDVPPGLGGLFARDQAGGSLEVLRTLRQPLLAAWPHSALELAGRADAVDFDRALPGDSRERVSLSLNLRQLPQAVFRFGFYHEWRRDRFDNLVPAAGATAAASSYF